MPRHTEKRMPLQWRGMEVQELRQCRMPEPRLFEPGFRPIRRLQEMRVPCGQGSGWSLMKHKAAGEPQFRQYTDRREDPAALYNLMIFHGGIIAEDN